MTTQTKLTTVLCAVVVGTITFFTNQIATAAETDAQPPKIETRAFKIDPNIFCLHIKTRFMEVPENNVENILSAGVAVDIKEKNTVEIIDAEKTELLLRQLDSASGVDTLGEPEVVIASLRQTHMRSTDSGNITATMDLVPALLADSFTVNLQAFVGKPDTLNTHANIWDGQTLALIAPKSDGKSRLVVFITAMVVNSEGNRIYSEKQKMKSNIPLQQ